MIAAETELVIFDADGTLRYVTVPGQHYPLTVSEQRLIPGVIDTFSHLPVARLKFGLASNQHGVALGQITRDDAYALLLATWQDAFGGNAPPISIEMCVCLPSAACHRRKPMPGMLIALLRRFGLPGNRALYVGDLPIDAEAAARAGIPFCIAADFFRRC